MSHRKKNFSVSLLLSLALLGPVAGRAAAAEPNALEKYVRQPDATFSWKFTEEKKIGDFTAARLELISQTWREQFWSHHLIVVRPKEVRHPELAFLFITGDGDGERYVDMLKVLAGRAGALAGVITKIPNQPLYGGKKEDTLIAYTFDRYLKTGDETWPLLFPMVKSAARGMDVMQAYAQRELKLNVEKFVLAGASKRGWTTWLTGAADPRVQAIAPMVIDMLNMKTQTDWARKMYGKQSEQISDYTDLNLVDRMDDPGMVRLRSWVDPYSYRERYTQPKLLLLGLNDPYWVVDSLRHYWNDLPGPKVVFQTPNAGHDLGGGKDATQTLAAWFQMIADKQPLPELTWKFEPQGQNSRLTVQSDRPVASFRLWTAESPDRDFRNDKWASREMELSGNNTAASAVIEKPAQGFRAYMAEAVLKAGTGDEYRLSTEARVVPDNVGKGE